MATKTAGIDFYKAWLGIPEEHRPPDHYRLLGLEPFEEDGGKIEEAWLARTKILRARQLDPRHGAIVQDLLNELAYAETVLTDRQKKRAYDEKIRSGLSLDHVDPQARVVVNLAPYVVGGKTRVRAVAARAGAGRRMVRIACPHCGHENQKGKLVCRNCGGYLVALPRRRSRFLGRDVPSWTWPVVAGAAAVAIVTGLVFALLPASPETPPAAAERDEGGPGHPPGTRRVRAAAGSFDAYFNRAAEKWNRVKPEPRSGSVHSSPVSDIFLVPLGTTAVGAEDGNVLVWNSRGSRDSPAFQASTLRRRIDAIRFDFQGHGYIAARGEPILEFEPVFRDSPARLDGPRRLGPTASLVSSRPIALNLGGTMIVFLTTGEASAGSLLLYEEKPSRWGIAYAAKTWPLPDVGQAFCAAVGDDGRLAVATAEEVLVLEGTPPSRTASLRVRPGTAPVELAFDPHAGVAALLPPAAGEHRARIVWLERPGDGKDEPAEAILDTDVEGAFWFGPEPDGLLFARAKGNAVQVWFASQGEARLLREFALPQGAVATTVMVDPAPLVAVGFSDGRLAVWNRHGTFGFPPEENRR